MRQVLIRYLVIILLELPVFHLYWLSEEHYVGSYIIQDACVDSQYYD